MSTALELGPEGWKKFVTAARGRNVAPPTPEEEARRSALIARAREAAARLKAEFGARRVVLFGSLAHGAWFDARSDVDLAVEGLAPGTYWAAWRCAEGCFPDRKVDVVEYEAVGESLRSAIDREGLDL